MELKQEMGKCPVCLDVSLSSSINKKQLVTAVEQNDWSLKRSFFEVFIK